MTAVARGGAGTVTGIIFLTVATIALVARLYTRVFLVRSAGIEEWTIIAAWVCCVNFSISIEMDTI